MLTQHGDELLDVLRSRLGLPGCLNPVQEGIPVPAVKRGEELARPFVFLQRQPQVVRDHLSGQFPSG
jgi:hypothetical protein